MNFLVFMAIVNVFPLTKHVCMMKNQMGHYYIADLQTIYKDACISFVKKASNVHTPIACHSIDCVTVYRTVYMEKMKPFAMHRSHVLECSNASLDNVSTDLISAMVCHNAKKTRMNCYVTYIAVPLVAFVLELPLIAQIII